MDKLIPTDSLATLIPGLIPTLITAPVGDYQPDLHLELKLANHGHNVVAGIDEAGRGPLAGPVVAAAVILNPNDVPDGLDDSKTLSVKRREQLYQEILQSCDVAIATINATTIDAINIRQATLLCMSRALDALPTNVDWCLIDGRDIPAAISCGATAVIKGDGRSKSIAAASIVAKVARDKLMTEAANTYPEYGFDKHKGYGTKAHRLAIARYGPCPLHRLSFAPIKYMIEIAT